jgi:uncharacterized protein YggE
MKNKTILIGIGLVFVALLLTGWNTYAELTDQTVVRSISVNGIGNASAIPDVVDIQLGVDTVDIDPVEAVSQNTAKMNAVMAVLDKMGIAATDIQTVAYSMWVEDVYDLDYQPTGEKRYHVTNQVNIRLRDLTQIGPLIEEATDAGATSVFGITFGVADTTELELAAIDNAIANARQKAEWIANELDVSIGTIVNVNEGGFYTQPVPFYGESGGLGGGGGAPISQGQFSMTTNVQVVYELIP